MLAQNLSCCIKLNARHARVLCLTLLSLLGAAG
jgi:hypothetical protein